MPNQGSSKIWRFFAIIIIAGAVGCTESNSTVPQFVNRAHESPSPSTTPSPPQNLDERAGIERLIYRIGPIDLPKGQAAEVMVDDPFVMTFQLDRARWVTGFLPKLVDAQGAALPGELLHEVLFSNLHDDNPLCAAKSGGNPFFAATSLLQPLDFPAGHGYPLLAGDGIESRVILKNPTPQDYRSVFFEMTFVTRDMNEFSRLKTVTPIFMEMDPCTHAPLQIPPGEFSSQTTTVVMPISGSLVVGLALLDDYGAFMTLEKKDSVEPFWKTSALIDTEHRVTELTKNPLVDPAGLPLAEGDELTLQIGYDNTSDAWRYDAIAGAMLYISTE
ncbi:MAG: hypothetical protein HY540_03995 [Deltaproteobacteria bacterium]|nr:hypothetical protein [Deltaproteobacteria bacterium]